MNIHGPGSVSGPDPVGRPNRMQPAAPPAQAAPAGDKVEISDLARLKSLLDRVPDIRTDRVEALRKEIASGDYESDEKFEVVVERLLEELGEA